MSVEFHTCISLDDNFGFVVWFIVCLVPCPFCLHGFKPSKWLTEMIVNILFILFLGVGTSEACAASMVQLHSISQCNFSKEWTLVHLKWHLSLFNFRFSLLHSYKSQHCIMIMALFVMLYNKNVTHNANMFGISLNILAIFTRTCPMLVLYQV